MSAPPSQGGEWEPRTTAGSPLTAASRKRWCSACPLYRGPGRLRVAGVPSRLPWPTAQSPQLRASYRLPRHQRARDHTRCPDHDAWPAMYVHQSSPTRYSWCAGMRCSQDDIRRDEKVPSGSPPGADASRPSTRHPPVRTEAASTPGCRSSASLAAAGFSQAAATAPPPPTWPRRTLQADLRRPERDPVQTAPM